MSARLYPRLRTFEARPLIDRLVSASLGELEAEQEVLPRGLVWAATGGVRASDKDLGQLRLAIRVAAEGAGYCYGAAVLGVATRAERLRLDRAVARVLFTRMRLTPNEASHGEAWRYLACVIAPELVRWRFAGEEATSAERFGSNLKRNTFARLWWRAHTFCDPSRTDPWWLFDALGEDEMVQITERPRAAGYGALAKAIVGGLLRVHDPEMHPNRSEILRDMMKRLLRRMPLLRYELLEPAELDAAVDELFDDTFAAKGLERSRQVALVSPAAPPPAVDEVFDDDEPTDEVEGLVTGNVPDLVAAESRPGGRYASRPQGLFHDLVLPTSLSQAAQVLLAAVEGTWLAKSDILERCAIDESIWLAAIQELVAAELVEQRGERRGRRYRRRPGAAGDSEAVAGQAQGDRGAPTAGE